MNKQIAKELNIFVTDIARRYSQHSREGNFNNETFTVDEIIPMSDHTASVVFKKNTGKCAAFFFYYIARGKSKGWKYFVPTDSHLAGMRMFDYYKMEVERENYKHNFNNDD